MRIAGFQRLAGYDDAATVVDRVLGDVGWADRQGIDLAVFPEAFLHGHSYERPLIERRAIALGDDTMQLLVEGLSRFRTRTVLGFFERRAMVVRNSAIVVGPGGLVGVYAKTHPIEDGCMPGGAYPVWRCEDRLFGVNICADLNHASASDRLVHQGASLICCPLNMMLRPKKAELWRERTIDYLRCCARRTGCWVVSSDVCGQNEAGWLSYGCTAVVDPDGPCKAESPS